jgi:hypothetical protein
VLVFSSYRYFISIENPLRRGETSELKERIVIVRNTLSVLQRSQRTSETRALYIPFLGMPEDVTAADVFARFERNGLFACVGTEYHIFSRSGLCANIRSSFG